MRAYAEAYLNDVVENQGKLFDFVAQQYPDKDTEAFINTYMASKTRKSIDEAKKIATDDMGVEFIDVDVNAFKQKVLPLHEKMLNENPKICDLYEHIKEANEAAAGKEGK